MGVTRAHFRTTTCGVLPLALRFQPEPAQLYRIRTLPLPIYSPLACTSFPLISSTSDSSTMGGFWTVWRVTRRVTVGADPLAGAFFVLGVAWWGLVTSSVQVKLAGFSHIGNHTHLDCPHRCTVFGPACIVCMSYWQTPSKHCCPDGRSHTWLVGTPTFPTPVSVTMDWREEWACAPPHRFHIPCELH